MNNFEYCCPTHVVFGKGTIAKLPELIDKSKKVLMIDADPQGNASSGVGIDRDDIELSIYDVLIDEIEFNNVVKKTNIKNL